MPYAVFSKRTKIVSRIIHDLTSLLPSESAIEVDDDIAYPRRQKAIPIGQQVNTKRFKLFEAADLSPTIKPYARVYDPVTDIAGKVKHTPLLIRAARLSGGDVQDPDEFIDLPIYANPFAWKAQEVAQIKYESMLAENYPYQVVIGEEFIDTKHIDASSSNYILSEGHCMLSPGGVLVTKEFSFRLPKRITFSTANYEKAFRYAFDTYFFSTNPEFPEGVQMAWRGDKYVDGSDTDYQDLVVDEEMPTLVGLETASTLLTTFQLKFTNLTPEMFEIENYVLFLRLRNVPGS